MFHNNCVAKNNFKMIYSIVIYFHYNKQFSYHKETVKFNHKYIILFLHMVYIGCIHIICLSVVLR